MRMGRTYPTWSGAENDNFCGSIGALMAWTIGPKVDRLTRTSRNVWQPQNAPRSIEQMEVKGSSGGSCKHWADDIVYNIIYDYVLPYIYILYNIHMYIHIYIYTHANGMNNKSQPYLNSCLNLRGGKNDSQSWFLYTASTGDGGLYVNKVVALGHRVRHSSGHLWLCRHMDGAWRYEYIYIFIYIYSV